MKKIIAIIIGWLILFAVNTLAQPRHTRQADMTGKDPYGDAPWRMKKTDTAGNLSSIPVHVFIHDADLVGHNAEVLAVNIRLKNATDNSFGNPVTFSTYSDSAFNALITCRSVNDPDFHSQSFDQSLPVKSAGKTVEFLEMSCSWPYTCTYTDITRRYWYFTFNIPPDKLTGYSDIIDIEVEFDLDWETNESTRLRVFRTSEEMPGLDDWYRGDVHFHSMYTTNEAEFGLPLCACREAAKKVGLDWITVTDHSCDYDNYNASMQSMWAKEGAEIQNLNSQDNSFTFIRGLEASCRNSAGDVVHLLNYPPAGNPGLMPFIADGGGDFFATNNTIGDFLTNLQQCGGFAFAAHPFAEGDKLSSLIGGGIWNISDSNFYANGSTIPGAGTVICNDHSVPSDVYNAVADSDLLRNTLVGGEIWNAYYDLTTTSDYTDPWDVTNDFWITPLQPMAVNDINQHMFRFRHGLDIADHMNRRGLHIKNQHPAAKNYRFFISAGSDAHGSFNYSSTDFVMGVSGFIDDNAIGKLNTLVYCPAGMGTQGSNILSAMQRGNMILSDGPVLLTGIDINNDNDIDLIPGQDTLIQNAAFSNARLTVKAISDTSFGTLDTVTLVICTEANKYILKTSISSGYQKSWTFDLDSLVSSVMYPDSLPDSGYFFIRGELQTIKNYGSQQGLYCISANHFNSFTNPVWIGRKVSTITADNNWPGNSFRIFPNPAHDRVYIQYSGSANTMTEISIYDVTGSMVSRSHVNGLSGAVQPYDISYLKPGLYILHLQNADFTSVFKLVLN